MTRSHTGTPPFGPDDINMKWRILYWFLMQGLGVVVMGVGLYVLYNDRKEERLQAQTCNERLIELNAEQLELIKDLREYIRKKDSFDIKNSRK